MAADRGELVEGVRRRGRYRRGGQVLAAVRPAGADNSIILCGCVIEGLPLRPGCNLPGALCLAGR